MEPQQEFDIKKYTQLMYQKRYIFAAIVVIVTSIAIAVSYVLPNTYEASSKVLIERNFTNTLIKDLAVTPSVGDRVRAVSVILTSRPLILKVIGDLDLDLTRKSDMEVEKLVQAFQKATLIDIDKRNSGGDMEMFTVSFRNQNPVMARDYVNLLVRRYVEENLSHNRDESYGANKFIQEQIELYKNKITSIETDITSMRRQKVVQKVIAGQEKQERMLALQKRLDALRMQYTDNHPEIIKLKSEIEELRNQSPGSKLADAARMGVQQPDLNLEDPVRGSDVAQDLGSSETGNILNDPAQKTQKQGAASSTSKLSKVSALERDLETYRKIYQDLMVALGRSEVSSHIEVQNKGGTFKILEPAILPFNPVSPDRVKFILLGLFGGIGGGIGFIIFLDSMDKSIKTVDTLKTFGLPVLAVIPHIQNLADIQKTKRHDLILYAMVGVYLVCVAGLLTFEFLKRGM